jgi:hypothetical protein
VAIRPLRVAELAEVLAVDFDDAEGIPKLNADWRWEDQEQALLIACSSLIAIVEAGDSRVVQFSHFSVKEFLTSSRLATATGEASGYHIDLFPAHTTLAQACLSVLLQTQHDVDGHTPKDHPLARYAAQYWTTHTQFEDVSSRLQKGMEHMFDRDKPHFEVWRTIFDIDPELTRGRGALFYFFTPITESAGTPLYYAAICGFHDLVEHLLIKYPQDVNADGGHCARPLLAALAGRHFQTADLLRQNSADPHPRGHLNNTPLHSAAYYGDLEVVQKLVECGASIGAKNLYGFTPLYYASFGDYGNYCSVLRLLLEHGADINARAGDGSTALHRASSYGRLEIVCLLLEHGAETKAKNNLGKTALQVAEEKGKFEVVKLLLEHKADFNTYLISRSLVHYYNTILYHANIYLLLLWSHWQL